MTSEEKRLLLESRPSFLFRQRSKLAQRELHEGIVGVIDIELVKAWDLNECRPPCCPHVYLFQVDVDEFVYAESWTVFNYPEDQFPRQRIKIVRSPLTKRILSAISEGEIATLEHNCFDPATDYFPLEANSECEILRIDEISEEGRSILAAT